MQRQNVLGQVMQASGDRALSPLGKSISSRDPEAWLQNQKRNDHVQRYQEAQMSRFGQKDEAQVLIKSIEALNDLAGEVKDHKIPVGRLKELEFNASQLRNLRTMHKTLDPEYAQAAGQALNAAGYSGPIEGIGTWMTRNVDKLTTQEMKNAAQWWADLEANIIAPWRHGLFGATLTPGEKEAFAALANMTPGMPSSEIRKRIQNLISARIEGSRVLSITTVENYGPGNIKMLRRLFGDLDASTTRTYDKNPDTEYGEQPDDGFSVEWGAQEGKNLEEEQAPYLPGKFLD
jgi:hypothetical protein